LIVPVTVGHGQKAIRGTVAFGCGSKGERRLCRRFSLMKPEGKDADDFARYGSEQ
jgi:hypothetical protein